MEYEEVIKKLDGIEKFGTVFGLERISAILEKLGNPQKELKVIHVAGTNGKGSVCAMISSILTHAGYNVGTYTSPHLKRFTERFLINGEEISEDDVVDLFQRVMEHRKDQTYFELVTAMAFLYFKEKKVDYLVLEVGMGGRLDATNVIGPLISIITNIAIEHSQHLGKTVEKIAYEKAGIIKEKRPVVTGAKGEALEVIKNVAKEKNTELFTPKYKLVNSSLCVDNYKNLELGLKGYFQYENASVAVMAIDVLNNFYKLGITEENIRNGLKNTKWKYRFEFLEKKVLIDCAHNPAGISTLKKELLNIKDNYEKIILVIGILKDKDYKTMLEDITPIADKVILTMAETYRAADPDVLKKHVKKDYEIIRDVKEAVKHAKKISGKNDLIVITGSSYVAGNV